VIPSVSNWTIEPAVAQVADRQTKKQLESTVRRLIIEDLLEDHVTRGQGQPRVA
jgi:hypothetical protein